MPEVSLGTAVSQYTSPGTLLSMRLPSSNLRLTFTVYLCLWILREPIFYYYRLRNPVSLSLWPLVLCFRAPQAYRGLVLLSAARFALLQSVGTESVFRFLLLTTDPQDIVRSQGLVTPARTMGLLLWTIFSFALWVRSTGHRPIPLT